MEVSAFEPKVDKKHKYAVAVPTGLGVVISIQSYETPKQLKKGYKFWQKYASERKITNPVPIEFLDKNGKCKVLTDVLNCELSAM